MDAEETDAWLYVFQMCVDCPGRDRVREHGFSITALLLAKEHSYQYKAIEAVEADKYHNWAKVTKLQDDALRYCESLATTYDWAYKITAADDQKHARNTLCTPGCWWFEFKIYKHAKSDHHKRPSFMVTPVPTKATDDVGTQTRAIETLEEHDCLRRIKTHYIERIENMLCEIVNVYDAALHLIVALKKEKQRKRTRL